MKTIIASILLLASITLSAQNKIIFQDDFENYSLGKWSWKDLCCSYSMTKDSAHTNFGKYCNKVLLYKTDPLVSGNHRAELVWNSNAYAQQSNTGVQWAGGAWLIPLDWVDDINHPESFINIHDGEPCANRGTNPQALVIGTSPTDGNKSHWYYWINKMDDKDYCSGGTIQRVATVDLGPVEKGAWVQFSVHSNWKADATGFVEVYRDNKKVVDYHGPCWFRGCFTEPYIKFGDYKFSWANETSWGGNSLATVRTFYQDNIKIGNSLCTSNDFYTPIYQQVNVPPVANAGPDQVLQPGVTSTTLKGEGVDFDGSIISYAWRTFLTPTGWYGTSTNQNWTITGYIPGKYGYELTVTDNKGAIAKDTMYVTAMSTNKPPVFDPIPNITLTLPVATTTLSANAVDPEGDSVSYVWSGPDGFYSNQKSVKISISKEGTYIFSVIATDIFGNQATKNISIFVNPIPPKLIVKVDSQIDPATGGYVVVLTMADGSTITYR